MKHKNLVIVISFLSTIIKCNFSKQSFENGEEVSGELVGLVYEYDVNFLSTKEKVLYSILTSTQARQLCNSKGRLYDSSYYYIIIYGSPSLMEVNGMGVVEVSENGLVNREGFFIMLVDKKRTKLRKHPAYDFVEVKTHRS